MAFSLQQFIANCRAAPGVQAVAAVMREAVKDPDAIREALATVAGERVLYQTTLLTVLNVVIPPGFRSPPHDHSIWAVVGIYDGQEDSVFYRNLGDHLAESERHEVRAPGVLVLGGTTIHAITNPLAQHTRGLHVYGGHLDTAPRSLWDPDTFEQSPFTREHAMAISKRLMATA